MLYSVRMTAPGIDQTFVVDGDRHLIVDYGGIHNKLPKVQNIVSGSTYTLTGSKSQTLVVRIQVTEDGVPFNALTLGGEPITLGGEFLTLGA